MAKPLNSLLRTRVLWAGLGTVALSGALVAAHTTEDAGLRAQDITPELIQQAARAEGRRSVHFSGAWVLDLVEPDQGEGGSEASLSALIAEYDGQPGLAVAKAGFYSEGEHLYRMDGDTERVTRAIAELGEHPWVEGIEPELIYSLPEHALTAADGPEATEVTPAKPGKDRLIPDDPMFNLQWHMEQIHGPEAWTKNRGKGAIVAIIDTGVAWKDAHGVKQVPDLAGTAFTGGETFVGGATPEGLDDHAHGTHVAGTVAQTTNNGVGVTGIAYEATIMPLKVLSQRGSGSVPGIANAVRYAADNGAHVINMSLGSPLPSKILAKAIEYAHERGVTVVAASGNEHRGRVGHPAASAHTIAVGAVDYAGDPTFYTNWGKHLDVMAPGGDTRADKNGDGHPDGVLQNSIKIQRPTENDYLWLQGTSMAAPHAAGVAGLIVASGVTNPDEVERIMKDTAVHPQGESWDKYYGAGIIDANGAAVSAQQHYAPERAGFAGLLGLLGLAGMGVTSLTTRRRRWLGAAGLVAGAAVASGALGTTPVAYGIAGGLAGTTALASFGSPLVLSAALPMLATLLVLGVRPLRGVLAGLNLGYAAVLAHGAVVLPTLVTGLPGGLTVDRLWLAANAVVCLLLARRVSKL